MPVLLPVEPDIFWQQLRMIIREELALLPEAGMKHKDLLQVSGLIQKPLFRSAEICTLFHISRPTLYAWIRAGKLRPVKIRSRVYFQGKEVMRLMEGHEL